MKNKILILAIGIMTLGGAASAKTLKTDTGPAERPPTSFTGKQYVDSKGCVYIRAGYGNRITWVPRVNRQRQVFCSRNNKPSLNPAQLAAISGEPATRLVKPAKTAEKKVENKEVASASAKAPVKTATVRGYTPSARQKNRDALRDNPNANSTAVVIRPVQAGVKYQQTVVLERGKTLGRGVDAMHNITIYPVVLDADITPRGDAQMALVWSDTVPRTLIKAGRAKRVASNEIYSTSKMR
ncbi:MAG: hypothetical protein IME92_10400 [Proteobacteria bacterium]|nr:hypothetical protein [Pseudomonadota bacterium]